MKKLIAMMLICVMLLALAACGAEEEPNADLVITRAAVEENETEAPTEAEEAPVEETEVPAPVAGGAVFAFELEGVEIIPGEPFDASVLPEAESLYTVPSCALEGTDNVYNYGTVEVTAFDEGNGEHVYSVYFLDPNITTPEGLALGDSMSKVTELYGEDYTEEGTSYIYTRGNTMLIVIIQGDVVASIEYRIAI